MVEKNKMPEFHENSLDQIEQTNDSEFIAIGSNKSDITFENLSIKRSIIINKNVNNQLITSNSAYIISGDVEFSMFSHEHNESCNILNEINEDFVSYHELINQEKSAIDQSQFCKLEKLRRINTINDKKLETDNVNANNQAENTQISYQNDRKSSVNNYNAEYSLRQYHITKDQNDLYQSSKLENLNDSYVESIYHNNFHNKNINICNKDERPEANLMHNNENTMYGGLYSRYVDIYSINKKQEGQALINITTNQLNHIIEELKALRRFARMIASFEIYNINHPDLNIVEFDKNGNFIKNIENIPIELNQLEEIINKTKDYISFSDEILKDDSNHDFYKDKNYLSPNDQSENINLSIAKKITRNLGEKLNAVISNIAKTHQAMQNENEKSIHDNTIEVIALSKAIATKMVDKIYEYIPEQVVHDFIESEIIEKQRVNPIKIVVHSSIKDIIQELLSMRDFNDLEIIQDDLMEKSDCKIFWEKGYSFKDKQLILNQLDAILERYVKKL